VGIGFARACNSPSDPRRNIAQGFKLCVYTTPLLVFTIFGILFSFLAQANVATVWIVLATRVETLNRARLKNLQRVIYAVEMVYFGLLTLSAVVLRISIALITTILFCLLLVTGYLYGGIALGSLLKQSLEFTQSYQYTRQTGTSAENLERSLLRVKYVTFTMSLLFMFQITALVVATVLVSAVGDTAYEEDMWFRPVSILLDLVLVVMIVLDAIVATYIDKSVTSLMTSLESKVGTSSQDAHALAQADGNQRPHNILEDATLQRTDNVAMIDNMTSMN
jgi:hypothetical protein